VDERSEVRLYLVTINPGGLIRFQLIFNKFGDTESGLGDLPSPPDRLVVRIVDVDRRLISPRKDRGGSLAGSWNICRAEKFRRVLEAILRAFFRFTFLSLLFFLRCLINLESFPMRFSEKRLCLSDHIGTRDRKEQSRMATG
jgi:hypothetical protein